MKPLQDIRVRLVGDRGLTSIGYWAPSSLLGLGACKTQGHASLSDFDSRESLKLLAVKFRWTF